MRTAKTIFFRILFYPVLILMKSLNLAFMLLEKWLGRKPLFPFLMAPALIAGLTAPLAQAVESVPWVSALAGKPGNLSLQHDNEDWFRAILNTPIAKGDNLWLEPGAKAEIFLNAGSFVRLAGAAGLRFDTVGETSLDLALNQGQALFQTGSDTRIYVVAPALGITIHPNTRARINVADDGSSELTTQRGEVELNGPAGSATIHAGQNLFATAGGNSYNLSAAPPPDDFDRWSETRDQQLASPTPTSAPVAQSLPPPVTYELSINGYWIADSAYGWCWRPGVVPDGWAPYRVGHWMWQTGWGWTWISYEPWGWYPYHYGRWTLGVSGWIWVPGPVVSMTWSPGAVFWLDGPDWIGWYPIPPQVDVALLQRHPQSIYQHIDLNHVTVVNIAHFNQTNYIKFNRPLPDDFRAITRPAVSPKHEFRNLKPTRDYLTPEPQGWLDPNLRPPDQVTRRVPPVWKPLPGEGSRQFGYKPWQPIFHRGPQKPPKLERSLPPGRGKDRNPPPRHLEEIRTPDRGPEKTTPQPPPPQPRTRDRGPGIFTPEPRPKNPNPSGGNSGQTTPPTRGIEPPIAPSPGPGPTTPPSQPRTGPPYPGHQPAPLPPGRPSPAPEKIKPKNKRRESSFRSLVPCPRPAGFSPGNLVGKQKAKLVRGKPSSSKAKSDKEKTRRPL